MKGRNALFVALAGLAVARVARVARARRKAAPKATTPGYPTPPMPTTSEDAPRPLQDTGVSAVPVPANQARPTVIRSGVQPRRLPAGSHRPQVHVGTGGARKDRRKRAMGRLAIVALVASLFGLPGVNLGFEFLGERLGAGEDRLTRAELKGVTTSESAEGLMRLRGNMFQSRPTPTPTPTETPTPEAPEPAAEPVAEPVPAPAGSVTEILYAAAAEFGIDGAYLVSVASCESGLNPGAVNPAGYHGLFQFAESTWASYGYGSIYDPAAQARTAARMLAAGMASHWPNCA